MPSKNETSRTKRRNFELVEETQSVESTTSSAVTTAITTITVIPGDEEVSTATELAGLERTREIDGAGKREPSRAHAPERKSDLPRRFGSYELVWEITRDALSTTYAARTDNIEKLLAVRIFSTRVTDAAQIRSIQKAAHKTAELTQLNIVTVYENGIGDNGAPYIVSDWVEGDTLAEVFQVSKRLDIARLLDIFNQISDALIEAHSRLLIHGNLSPTKIVLADNDDDVDCVKVIDFGMPPDPVQHAFCLSPEQRLDSSKADARSDIYALGCMMYEALVGMPPFVGHKVTNASLNCLHELASQYSPASPEHNALKLLDCIIVKCLQQNPTKRFRNVREFVDALRLVNECICGGNTRKLPPKADKLLLFRFLDFTDKKIVAGAFAYIILAGLTVDFIGENQLQKYIDEAQLAKRSHQLVSQEYWLGAIQQAQSLGKPPSLLADLHWELGDVYNEQLMESIAGGKINVGLANQVVEQYEKAADYFCHGLRYQAYSLDLLHAIANICSLKDDKAIAQQQRDAVIKNVKSLFKQRRYKECADVCAEYLRLRPDNQISFFAASACNEYGTTLPAKEGVRWFERALHYSRQCNINQQTQFMNLATCTRNLNYGTEPHHRLAVESLAAGDLEAFSGELRTFAYGSDFKIPIENFFHTRTEATNALEPGLNVKKSTIALERALKIEEKCYGLHNDALIPTLSSLAIAYAQMGQDEKAIAAFDRLFTMYKVGPVVPSSGSGSFIGALVPPYPSGHLITGADGFTRVADDKTVGGDASNDQTSSGEPRDQFAEGGNAGEGTDNFSTGGAAGAVMPAPSGDCLSFIRWEDPGMLVYVDLLAKHGQNKKAIKFMEKEIFKHGIYENENILFPRLVQAYAAEKEYDKAKYAAAQALSGVEFFNSPYDVVPETGRK
jgi:serine/threonine protein kinase